MRKQNDTTKLSAHATDCNRYLNGQGKSPAVQRLAKTQVHTPTDSEPTEQVDPQKSPQEGTKQYSV